MDDKLEPIVGRSVKKDTSLKFSADTNNGIADVRITGDINGTPHDDRYDLEDLSKGITFPK
ncbi:hypothetical protein N182_06175 [Sinorhizobium sp. GL2]|nr:hypothetical protein N182_06175 [Sinorhizobium sp. GL2]